MIVEGPQVFKEGEGRAALGAWRLSCAAYILRRGSHFYRTFELLAALEEARRRISAVSLVHRRLYRGDQLALVDAARYIEELCADTFAFMGQDWAQHLSLNLSPVMVSTDRAVTLGLLLTELLINANKYAYDGLAGPIND